MSENVLRIVLLVQVVVQAGLSLFFIRRSRAAASVFRRREEGVALSALLAQRGYVSFIRLCGENSLPVYLAFFLPMAATRILINKSGLIADAGTEAAIVTAAAVAGALVIHRLVMPTRMRFLFERPDAFRMTPQLHLAAQR